jgi:peptide/nickel transport system permease protein
MQQEAAFSPKPRPVVALQKPNSIWRDAFYRLARNRAALLSGIFLLLLLVVTVFAEQIAPYDPLVADFTAIRQAPSAAHWFGTDEIGRDVFSRVVFGARISLFVGLFVQTAATLIGVFLGLLAGYYGGWADMLIMRAVDIMYALPPFLFAVFMVSLLTPDVSSVILTLTLSSWPFSARLVRAQALSLKQQDYVLSARALGARGGRILFFHILPNAMTPIIIQFTLGIATVIMAEAGLSFLGIGIRPPNPTWGGMISKARDLIRTEPYLALYPSIALGLTMIAINFLGDGLRDALDPRMKK